MCMFAAAVSYAPGKVPQTRSDGNHSLKARLDQLLNGPGLAFCTVDKAGNEDDTTRQA
jgi:hypothetical protein